MKTCSIVPCFSRELNCGWSSFNVFPVMKCRHWSFLWVHLLFNDSKTYLIQNLKRKFYLHLWQMEDEYLLHMFCKCRPIGVTSFPAWTGCFHPFSNFLHRKVSWWNSSCSRWPLKVSWSEQPAVGNYFFRFGDLRAGHPLFSLRFNITLKTAWQPKSLIGSTLIWLYSTLFIYFRKFTQLVDLPVSGIFFML